ncbi:ATP-dependent DNA ligase [Streptomyces sp. A1136]|uniref:ATP-dependent DNA ligase n=1 Tax=Streptomyces sp. A1136 TaxID=2563102 RepID=UPI001F0E0F93|nr:ATP-dependent DNA ligase [Streptomyces sp. A1136]
MNWSVWDTAASGLSFEGLQCRTAARGRAARELAGSLPAFFIAFDVLQENGVELLRHPYRQRRLRLEALFTGHRLKSSWTLCPMTTDLITAQKWLDTWTDVPGLEGIVVKAMNQLYQPGYRSWHKRRRDTTEAIIGAITGTLLRPQLLLLGRHDTHDRLRPIGRTAPLRPEAAHLVGENLSAADPDRPWTGMRFASAWGSRDVLEVTLVRPEPVAEISAYTAVDHGGIYRHPGRFKRLRPDLTTRDVPRFGANRDTIAG